MYDIILYAYIYKKNLYGFVYGKIYFFFCSYTNIQPSTSNILYVLQNYI